MSKFSGIEINENGPVSGTVTGWQSRTFRLPANYKRGNRIPEITGLQFCHDISDEENFAVDFRLEINLITGPLLVQSGSMTGSNVAGTYIWSEIYFQNPVELEEDWLNRDFTVSVNANAPTWTTADGIRFRLMADVADSGEDFLGNKYRSVVERSKSASVSTNATTAVNSYWLSKPNPSKFAVESLYFDLRGIDNRVTVVDRILLDPITPGILFHVYYSDEGNPGQNEADWESKLWTPVSQTFRADRRQEHALPQPITARYVKLEFSHLQAQHYSPGTFSQPTVYKKHPKWVLDYFLALMGSEEMTDDPFVARRIAVVYDAYDLAFNYYLDDLKQDPAQPDQMVKTSEGLSEFFSDREDVSDQVDTETMQRIRLSLQPFTQHPASLAKGLEYLLGLYAAGTTDKNYPVEQIREAIADTTSVSTLDRSSLVLEQNFPAMFFYLRSRHKYREVAAPFREDRAYFAGIRELAFTRDHYSVASDTDLYVETLADFANAMRNDFVEDGFPPNIRGPVV